MWTLATLFSLIGGFQVAWGSKPSEGCGKAAAVAAGTHSLVINRRDWWYVLKLPDYYQNDQPYRLIITHQTTKTDANQVIAGTGGYLPWYGLPSLINDTSSAIFVAPSAPGKTWYTDVPGGLKLLSSIVDTVKAGICIDEDLIFATGFSSGAEMAYSIACSLAKTFRAVAAQSGNNAFACSGGSDPIAFYGQHGVSDTVLPISDARDMRDRFVKNNGCTPIADKASMSPKTSSGTHVKTVYKGCKEGYPVTWIEFDGSHTPQPKDRGVNKTFAADETWAFFSQFR